MISPNDANSAAFRNRAAIERALEVSCYYCLRTFDPTAIEKWTDEGETACCPHCEVDAVLPGRIERAELRALHAHWFSGDAGGP
jgi:hypothetical protein